MSSTMIVDLSVSLLIEAFWCSWENIASDDWITEAEVQKVRQRYYCQQEISETFDALLREFEISDIEDFLPITLTQQIVDKCNQAWGDKFSVEELYEINQLATYHLVMGFVGYGCTATDDPNVFILFQEKEITKPRGHFESAYNEAEKLIDAIRFNILKKHTEICH
ncbi:hypothetical protein FD723_39920 (plasmid) [Nostoc sp. C052]|uniref:hypothetical protein n=1 Tax=Nostoc sp. C052 TaxID=2576902 RepID=UPI0015C397A4|nr:hypothetical protein [Nostoc sp. C052]QLE46381.1 hypothetical protein FD723_39920 [Nostoc sp. C052]